MSFEIIAFYKNCCSLLFRELCKWCRPSTLYSDIQDGTVYASYLIRIRLLENIRKEYIYYFFDSKCYWNQIIEKAVGVDQPNCNGTPLKELFIHLPPISEQNKIVIKNSRTTCQSQR